jgi:membrane-bound lytic murein transglycosylase D
MIGLRNLGIVALLAAWTAATAMAATEPLQAPIAPAILPPAFDDETDVPLPDPDLWQRIRKGFMLEPLDSPLVPGHEAWYSSRPEYIKRFIDRGSLYLHYIVEEVEKRGMPTEIALLPAVESAFNPRAYSRAKASGLWQFIPSTGRNYGLAQDWWKDNRRDIVAGTDAALNYLQRLYNMFGSWELALAAYNCGEGCVGRAIALNQRKGLPTDYLSLRLPPETQNYVPKLIAVKNIVLSPSTYGIEIDSIPDQAYFTAVRAPDKIDVKLAAKLAGMGEEEFIALNPSHNKPVAVAQTGTLLVPLENADTFRANLESYDKPLVSWTTYQAKKGEAPEAIAKRFGVTPAQLRGVNQMKLTKKGKLANAQQVLVPIRTGAGTATKVAAGPQPSPALAPAAMSQPASAKPAAHAHGWYTVRAGDTLYAIAQRHNKAVQDLIRLNNLTARALIQPGLRLRLN